MGSTSTPGRLHVLVAGGGIGGLAAAVALRKQGHEVEVFEKSTLHREFGAAVYVAPNCTVALSHLDVHPEDYKGNLYRGFRFLDSECKVNAQKTFTDEEKAQWPDAWWLASRIDLHNALKQKAISPDGPGVPVRIHTGSGVDSVDCETGNIALSNGTTVAGDVVVCADGIHSITRRSVLGSEVALYGTGNACYRWLVPTSVLAGDPDTRMFVSMPGHFVQSTAEDRRVLFYPVAGGTVQNCAALVPRREVGEIKRGPSGYDQGVNKEQFMNHFTNFAQPVRRMLELAPEESLKLWDLLDMELQPSLIKEKAVLIGDAAHPFLPYLGQGAAQAIEDACALGVVLPPETPAEEIPQRLELWQRIRKDRAYKIVEDTRIRGREVDEKDSSPEAMARFNAAMKYCIDHDAWKYAEEQLKVWTKQKA